MIPFLVSEFANPSSSHRAGQRAQSAIEAARQRLADAIECFSEEIVFTSGATESTALALSGCARRSIQTRRKIVTTTVEHKAVLKAAAALANSGFKVVHVPVRSDGLVDLAALADAVDEETLLVSVQAVNNEVGTIQPILECAQLAHRSGAIFHTDAAQALGKIPFAVDELEVDLASMSAHKIYGPKGIGALYVRGGASSGLISPLFHGGSQERSLRPGTENVSGIVGFGTAVEIALERSDVDVRHVASLRNALESRLLEALPHARVNGARGKRIANCSSITVPGVSSDALIANVPEIQISSSSACTSGSIEPSHVLMAMGLSTDEATSTIRFGLGRFTHSWEIEYAARRIGSAARKLMEVLGRWACEGQSRMLR